MPLCRSSTSVLVAVVVAFAMMGVTLAPVSGHARGDTVKKCRGIHTAVREGTAEAATVIGECSVQEQTVEEGAATLDYIDMKCPEGDICEFRAKVTADNKVLKIIGPVKRIPRKAR